VANSDGFNYCEVKYQAYENSKFRINIVAQDDDPRSPNGDIRLRSPDLTDRSPQYSFNLSTVSAQMGRQLRGVVENLEEFDYENPKYGSNTLNLMFYAEDLGLPKRVGYCFMSIEILDVNDNVPVFAQRTYNIYIHEQYKTRHFAYRFVAIDKDSGLNGRVEYFMDTANNNAMAARLFTLSLDGTLTVRNASCLDDLAERLEFKIYAEDCSPTRNRSEFVTVFIIKTTLKLLPPFFSDFPDPAEITQVSEMVTRGSVLRNFPIVIQTDPNNQFLRCFLSPKPNPEWFKFEFQIKPNLNLSKTETCSLKIEDPLNYRIASSMVIYMIAEVGSNSIASTARELKILTVYLKEENINPPKFVSNTIEASVVESNDDLNKVIAVVKAYDIDKTAPNNQITYSFDSQGKQLNDADGYFSIDQNTGEIRLIKPIRNKKNIPLEVFARDGINGFNMNQPNQNSIYVDVKVIDMNDNPPVFNQNSYQFTVDETVRPGYVVGYLEVMDQDTLSNFNYSIGDSTFGIRGIYDSNKIKAHMHYRGSAEIYVNNYLDYTRVRTYVLTVYVSDSQFVNTATVTINVRNNYDKPPRWAQLPYDVQIDEEFLPTSAIATLAAINDDNQSTDFIFECYSTPQVDKKWFDLNPRTGELRLLKGLDRDPPYGMEVYNLQVSVAYAANPTLRAFTTVRIRLKDINDNAPYLLYGGQQPLIIMEETAINAGFVEIAVIDVDTPPNGPPFQFTLDAYTDIFALQQTSCQGSNCVGREIYRLLNNRVLRRSDQKYFIIPYTLKDNGGLSRNGSFQLIVGDIDNNPQSNGTKQIKVLSYERNIQPGLFMGTLYVRDLDDWDLVSKTATNCMQSTGSAFDVRQGLQIYGPMSYDNFPRDNMNLQCAVTDMSSASAQARVDFSIDNIEYADTIDLTVIRVLGITAESLMLKISTGDTSVYEFLVSKIVSILQLSPSDTIKVVTLRNYARTDTKVSAIFSNHNSLKTNSV
jgi:hypothetical protein